MGWEVYARVSFYKGDKCVYKTYISYRDGTEEVDVSNIDFDRIRIKCMTDANSDTDSENSSSESDPENSSNEN